MNFNGIPVQTIHSDLYSEVYNEYFPKVYKYILYRVGDISTAEDLVSEVFEKVLVKFNTYNPGKGKFSTWLFTIANNTIINYFKKNNRHTEPIDLEKVESKYRLEDLIIDRELKELLLKAIMGLDDRQRNVIALKFGACLTNRQIARMVNITESNVGTILYRSLKKLKDILKEQGVVY
ncbi:sigma-70 family RNA polymerase sigma factor [Desulfoscipio sp. XC116]|uniref:RNA polymerase sigma factor n=1 Tax=Desulfoscipio sp. XC116 TaxID=3144975 RepID=UPI00325B97E9